MVYSVIRCMKLPKKWRKSAFAIQSIIQLTTMAENNTFTELVTTRKSVLNCRLHINGETSGIHQDMTYHAPEKFTPSVLQNSGQVNGNCITARIQLNFLVIYCNDQTKPGRRFIFIKRSESPFKPTQWQDLQGKSLKDSDLSNRA